MVLRLVEHNAYGRLPDKAALGNRPSIVAQHLPPTFFFSPGSIPCRRGLQTAYEYIRRKHTLHNTTTQSTVALRTRVGSAILADRDRSRHCTWHWRLRTLRILSLASSITEGAEPTCTVSPALASQHTALPQRLGRAARKGGAWRGQDTPLGRPRKQSRRDP